MGQGAIEYIVFLAICSALLVFGASYLTQVRDGVDNAFAVAVERMLKP